ncbi:galactokinase [Egibacter rhizosphaerae]|uniref:Galactokinase n=1 Tax=Egibacter rhizosphaerae TaxID=1670831 RepID=A0A411YK43_9ACTN|nr:galactokinase [Egibacter rhizosphaerae]QBI21566.1 galactokinase [Egibacter rhizosphaerae]
MSGHPAIDRAARAARDRWGAAPTLVARAPGRVNLIGDHTDYNDGFVLPLAIDRDTAVAVRPRGDGRVVLHSEATAAPATFEVAEVGERLTGWAAYPQGVVHELRYRGVAVGGFEATIASDVPLGSGLSSSASLEVAVAVAVSGLAGATLPPEVVARVAQRAETRWAGVPCGIMDQLAVAASRDGAALRIDCRDLSLRAVPVPPDVAVLVLDTGTRRELAGSHYQRRREECAEAASALGVATLRHLDPEADGRLPESVAAIDRPLAARVRHVLTENARVLETATALAAGDVEGAGTLMDASHVSLRDDYEVSTPELDTVVEHARAQPGCHGARLTGAGFGGCAVALADADRACDVAEAVGSAYRAATGRDAASYRCRPAEGAALL